MNKANTFAVALLLAAKERGEVPTITMATVEQAQAGSYEIRCVVVDDDNIQLELIDLHKENIDG